MHAILQVQTNKFIIYFLVAWTVTEIVRYSFYFFSLLGHVPYFLKWCRLVSQLFFFFFGVAFVLHVAFGVVCVLLYFLHGKDCADNFGQEGVPVYAHSQQTPLCSIADVDSSSDMHFCKDWDSCDPFSRQGVKVSLRMYPVFTHMQG